MLSLSNVRTLSTHLSEAYDGKAYTLSLSANEDVSLGHICVYRNVEY